jgi:protease-4
MRRSPFLVILFLIFVFGSLFVFFSGTSAISLFGGSEENVKVSAKNSILLIDLEGIILDSKKFVKNLKKYRKDNKIKAVVININSPGGVVGPSQEIYAEIKKIRDEFKKPVVAVSTNLLASGAYYSAVAADKIVVAPGSMVGSIGVIMEFANLEKLYDWAKISRFTITTGKYKDSGSEYRAMRDDERKIFQDLIDDVYTQFVVAVSEGRNLKEEEVKAYADGRVFTGAQAVKLGFADKVGTTDDAINLAAEMAHLGKDFEVFEIPKNKNSLFELLSMEDEASSLFKGKTSAALEKSFENIFSKAVKADLLNQPLFILPGFWNH